MLNNGYCLPSALITGSSSSQSQSSTSSQPQTTSSTIFVPCTSQQYYKDGVCKDAPAQCTQFDISSGACYACAQGYSLNSGSCVQNTIGTQNSLSTSSSNLSLGGNVANCQQVDPKDTTKCLICASGYTIVDVFPGVCYKIY